MLLLTISGQAEARRPMQDTVRGALSTDARWQPWLGCWELSREVAEDGEPPVSTESPAPATAPVDSRGVRVCVAPADATSGVRMSTEVQGTRVLEETLVADGTSQAVDDKGCRGSRRAEWSHNGLRVFGQAEITCAGEQRHVVSHLATIVGGTWIDVQGITREGREALRVRRYSRVGDEALGSHPADVPGAGAFGIEDVKEATQKVTPLVLQAALVETGARFRLRARTMLELDRAGVPDEVTDLMIALSYPDRFRVARLEGSAGGGQGPASEDWDEWPSDAYLWGYAPFAYSYWQFNDYWYSQDVVIIGDGDSGRPGGGGSQSGSGRVVNGQGYTRIEPVVSVTHATPGNSTSADSTSSTASSSGDSSGVSSQGYSSGGSSGDSDRTAQPRPPDR